MKIDLARGKRVAVAALLVAFSTACTLSKSEEPPPEEPTNPVSLQISVTPATLDFGSVLVDESSSQIITLKNTGNGEVTVTQTTITGSDFSLSGLTFPLTLTKGSSASFFVGFAPSAAGSVTGSVSFPSNADNSPTGLSLTGAGLVVEADGQLNLSPAGMVFGEVSVGNSATRSVTLSNSDNAPITISSANITGSGFSVSGITFPLSLPSGGTTTADVTFSPATAGAAGGSLSFTSDAPNSPTSLSLSATGTQGRLSLNPTSINFGDVTVGSNGSRNVTLSNSGDATLTVWSANVTGGQFSVSGLSFPVSLNPGATTTANVAFSPAAEGAVTGSISFVSDGSNSPTTFSLSGAGVPPPAPGQLTLNPAGLDFGSVNVGSSSTLSVTLSNSGETTLSVSSGNVTGAGFSLNGLSFPVSLNPGATITANVAFSPAAEGAVTGSVSFTSDGAISPTALSLSGTGAVAATSGRLSLNPTSIDFGDVSVGSSGTRNVTLSNSGDAVLLISSANVTGADFSVDGSVFPINLSPGESSTVNVTFTPSAGGVANGSVSFTSDGDNSPTALPLTGNGTEILSVSLAWDTSPSVIDGYNVYRGTLTGGPYTKLNTSLVVDTTFIDNNAMSGNNYFYVVKAVDAAGLESVKSNEAQAAP